MFGVFKTKELDFKLLKTNLAEAVVMVWSDGRTLSLDDFNKSDFIVAVATDQKFIPRFFREKLRFIVAVMLICAYKAEVSNEQLDELVVAVKARLKEMNTSELPGLEISLSDKAENYARIRMSGNAGQAGRKIENRFCQEAFGFTPSESNVDAQYVLYKKLSALERKAIFAMNAAIRESRV